jgi:ethanolamine utilization protein EutA (predicted chaperonin)
MFNPVELKEIALSKKVKEKSTDLPPEINQSDVDHHVEDLENYVTTFANEGFLSVDYKFDKHPMNLIYAVAQSFKHKHPLLMIITSEGTKTLTVTWDGMNHV